MQVFGCNFSPDGHYLAVGCSAGRVLLLDSATRYSAARFITGFEDDVRRPLCTAVAMIAPRH